MARLQLLTYSGYVGIRVTRRWSPVAPHAVLSLSVLIALSIAFRPAAIPGRTFEASPPSTAASATVSAATAPQVQARTFWSQALGREMAYSVFLPPGYDSEPDARYPVLYMLHGLGADQTQWIRDGLFTAATDLMQGGQIPAFIIVVPNGENGYWVDHANNGPRFGSYVAHDLVAMIDAEYRTLDSRDSRAIGGMSMGGHGALQLALNAPETFRVVGAHSVALRRKDQAFEFFGDQRYFQAHDPVSLIQAHPDVARQLVISMDIGADDQWAAQATAFHEQLLARGIAHRWSVRQGAHNDSYWAAHVADYLRFYGEALRSAPGA
jgi:enterochelin esterase-like enzyme